MRPFVGFLRCADHTQMSSRCLITIPLSDEDAGIQRLRHPVTYMELESKPRSVFFRRLCPFTPNKGPDSEETQPLSFHTDDMPGARIFKVEPNSQSPKSRKKQMSITEEWIMKHGPAIQLIPSATDRNKALIQLTT